MKDVLLAVLNMSVTASVVILFVLAARLLLKRSPRIFSYALWAVVLFRLLCPVSIAADFSLLGLLDAPAAEATEHTTTLTYVPQDVIYRPNTGTYSPNIHPAPGSGAQEAVPPTPDTAAEPLTVAAIVWLSGIGVIVIYSIIAFVKVKRRLMGSVRLRENIYLADYVDSPFVMGWLRPRIYLPSSLSDREQGYIILHEQHHIRRGDHIIKTLAFLALCIHWFNPLVWLAFVLSGKDMEMSCDEAVVKKLGEGIRHDYSASLLSLATGRRIIAGTPLAFGEGDTKSRIKNMLHWKQAKPVVLALSAVAVIFALIACGTNAGENNSWIKATHGATSVELACSFEDSIRSYAIYEDIYENGELLSSEAILFDGFQEEGGAAPRRTTLSLNAQTVHDGKGGFSGELFLHSGAASMTRKLPKDYYTGAAHIAAEIGSGIRKKQEVAVEDSIPLMTILLSADPEGSVVLEATDSTLAEQNDTVVIYRLVTSGKGIEQYIQQEKPLTDQPVETQKTPSAAPELLKDAVYYLELAAGEAFRDMGFKNRTGLLVEYEDLLDNYDLIARESADGSSAYIAGQYKSNPAESPLHGMYSVEFSLGATKTMQLLYREEDSAAVEAALASQKMPSVGYCITDSRIYWSSDTGLVLIQPNDTALRLDVAWNRYLYTPNGREYIIDAVSRGIDVCGRTDTYLYVYRISERFGEIAERIPLTEADANAILEEKRVKITDGFGFAATLHIKGETTYYNEHSGIPQTVLDMAVEMCDYRFGDPGMITDSIREARLDCDWLDAPLYAKAENLPRLREILKNAEFGYVGSCGYGAKLSLTFTGGEKLTLFKGCDGCDSIVFGSYGGYFLGDRENTEFWEIFGLDVNTKQPLSHTEQASPENPGNSAATTAFSPADVNYERQALTTSPDEMTYQERLVWAQAGPDYRQFHTSLGRCIEEDGCIAYLGQWVGTPHADQYTFHVRLADGSTAQLPLPWSGTWGVALPDTMTFRNGTLIYETTFSSEETADDGNMLIHLKGTYHYEVDLADRSVSLTVLQ